MNYRFKNFTILINKITRSIRKIKSEEMSKFGLKSVHVSCLYYLYKEDEGLSAKKLCCICDEDKGSVSRSIEYLEERGYVSCASKFEKRYNSPIKLTKEGEKIAKIISEKIDGNLLLASEGLDNATREILYSSLNIISENLQKICKKLEENNGC